MKTVVRLLLISLAIGMLTACAFGNPNLAQDDSYKESWMVDESLEATFRVYKDYAEREFSGGGYLGFEGVTTKGYYYSESAELIIGIDGSSFASGPFLRFDFEKNNDSTHVIARGHNEAWRQHALKFKDLL